MKCIDKLHCKKQVENNNVVQHHLGTNDATRVQNKKLRNGNAICAQCKALPEQFDEIQARQKH